MHSMITLYGIPNCDTVKKARAWLTEHGVEYAFHDFKKQGVPADLAPGWARAVGWEKLLNRKGTAWRALDAATQASVVDVQSACAVMQNHASTVKRPVVVWRDDSVTVGFDTTIWTARLP